MDTIILQFFEGLRSSFGTFLSCVFSLFGETIFLIVVICLIYWIYDKKFGEKLIAVSFSSMTINGFLKGMVARPRPYAAGVVTRVDIDTPLISTTSLSANSSFPSGHSQMSAGLFFTSAFHFKQTWSWIVFPLATLGVMLSRLYFGVHYPTDVLVGATLGALFAIFWEFIYQKAEDKKHLISAIFAVISIIFSIICPTILFELKQGLHSDNIAFHSGDFADVDHLTGAIFFSGDLHNN
jgi:membrane-associated phospholipid phosphatase